jgi:hypothetical protein
VDWDPVDAPARPTRSGWEQAVQALVARSSADNPQPQAPAMARAAGLSAADATRLRMRRVFESSAQTRLFLGGMSHALEFMNAPVVVATDAEGPEPYSGWKDLNATIVEHIRSAARRHPGGRLVVVYGGAHKPLLDAGLAHVPDVRLRQPGDWFPLSDATVSQFDSAEDLKLLFLSATEDLVLLCNPDAVHRPWLRTQIPTFEKIAARDLEARYYLARWLTIEGNWKDAGRLLQEVADEAKDQAIGQEPAWINTTWFWPPDFSLRRRALFALALVDDLAGRRDAAVAIYAGLREELAKQIAAEGAAAKPVPAGTRVVATPASRFMRWLDLFITEPYVDHPDQYLRGLGY